ncbi:MAG: hypothetical protein EOO36_08410 [Cytophagaceae bacterium]|nr:MAG: hypothetical protein EOO36_08410 [Cytophagaceae bacterium]
MARGKNCRCQLETGHNLRARKLFPWLRTKKSPVGLIGFVAVARPALVSVASAAPRWVGRARLAAYWRADY